jgi:hypothetical protein
MRSKKILWILTALIMLVALSACSANDSLVGEEAEKQASEAGDTPKAEGENEGVEAQEMTYISSREGFGQTLAAGLLLLEDGSLAVTAEQAGQLLPLWKAVNNLGSSGTAAPEEMQALYEQVQETLTREQVQALESMEIGQEDLQALMDKLGILPGNAAYRPDNGGTQAAAGAPEGMPQGGGPGDGMGPMDGSGGGAALAGGAPIPDAGQGTSVPGAGLNGNLLGMNRLFMESLLEMLETRAGF